MKRELLKFVRHYTLKELSFELGYSLVGDAMSGLIDTGEIGTADINSCVERRHRGH